MSPTQRSGGALGFTARGFSGSRGQGSVWLTVIARSVDGRLKATTASNSTEKMQADFRSGPIGGIIDANSLLLGNLIDSSFDESLKGRLYRDGSGEIVLSFALLPLLQSNQAAVHIGLSVA